MGSGTTVAFLTGRDDEIAGGRLRGRPLGRGPVHSIRGMSSLKEGEEGAEKPGFPGESPIWYDRRR